MNKLYGLLFICATFYLHTFTVEEEFPTREEELEHEAKEKQEEIDRKRKEIIDKEKEIEEREEEKASSPPKRQHELEIEIGHIEQEKETVEEEKEDAEEAHEKIVEEIKEIKESLQDAFKDREEKKPDDKEDDIDKCEKKFMNEHVVLNESSKEATLALNTFRKALDALLRYEFIKFSNARDISPSRWERIEANAMQAQPGDDAYDPDFKQLLEDYKRAKADLEKYTEYAIPPKDDAAQACRNSLIEMVEKLLKKDDNKKKTSKKGLLGILSD